jgi:hypothetical protein
MTTKTLQALLIAALLASVSAFADQSIEVSVVNGKQQAAFSVGDSSARLMAGFFLPCSWAGLRTGAGAASGAPGTGRSRGRW